MDQDVRRIEVDGIGLRVERRGAGEGPPLLFLHGWLRSSHEWRYLMPPMSTIVPCVSIDLPGCGGSDAPAEAPYDLPWLTAKVWGALDQLGIERVRLFTHGLGGAIGLRMCLDAPERVQAHVSASPSTLPNPLEGLRGKHLTRSPLGLIGAKVLLTRERVREMLLTRQYHEPLRMSEELMDVVMAPLERPGGKEAAWRLLLTDMDPGLEPEVFQLRVPTTLIWGYSDRVNLVDLAKRLEAEVDVVTLCQIPNCGYMAIETRPLSVAIHACRALGLPLPEGVEDGHPAPGTMDFA
ncbi:MAG: alpha/beta fold hydrolase [Alphaproteobacteria bacterium]|nr:alpha/beta fold hydrolase [Alphaproteobacteria bacterium]MCB9791782.1 alpha/beta fold hydrolase [Alphaproteobacteria bacterium]